MLDVILRACVEREIDSARSVLGRSVVGHPRSRVHITCCAARIRRRAARRAERGARLRPSGSANFRRRLGRAAPPQPRQSRLTRLRRPSPLRAHRQKCTRRVHGVCTCTRGWWRWPCTRCTRVQHRHLWVIARCTVKLHVCISFWPGRLRARVQLDLGPCRPYTP
jgi:hypothetical protein